MRVCRPGFLAVLALGVSATIALAQQPPTATPQIQQPAGAPPTAAPQPGTAQPAPPGAGTPPPATAPQPGVAPPAAAAPQPAAAPRATDPGRPVDAAGAFGGNYRIGPEDVLQVVVWKNDAMSRVVAVRPDGSISLPLLNDVPAAGLTPTQLRDDLVKRLAEYMPAPEVSVIVTEVRSFKVSVLGEVLRPGRYDLKSATTALDIIAAAGGFTTFAKPSKIVVLRPTSTGTRGVVGDGQPQATASMKRIPFNYNRVVSSGGESENFYLQPGDIVLVP